MTVREIAPAPHGEASPLMARGDYAEPSVFRPENMLREARRQKGLGAGALPPICVLDPDGDIVRYVRFALGGERSPTWACYHTELWEWTEDGVRFGVVGRAVGGSFAVLVAEQLFACGCRFLVSISSAGQITPVESPPYHVLLDRVLRDEGTSYHYLAPSRFVETDASLLALAQDALAEAGITVRTGMGWTTDAPFRETSTVIAERAAEGVLVVDMESAALMAFAAAQDRPVLCVAHVTNRLGRVEGDFEKGEHNGAACSLAIVRTVVEAWSASGAGEVLEAAAG